jgi:hypothetical protein
MGTALARRWNGVKEDGNDLWQRITPYRQVICGHYVRGYHRSVIRSNSNSIEEKKGVRLEVHVMITLFVNITVIIELRVFRSVGE